MTDPLELISFPGTGNLPFFAGSEKGLYEARGVSVNLETTPSSMYQAQHLVAGKFQLACTAADNVVAYQEGAGEVELDREPDLFMVMGATQIEVAFVVRPEIETYEDVKGKTLALDALATGFAFALYRMLDNAGLTKDDYEMVSVGSTPSRWEAVQEGTHAGTLLIEPFTSMARAAGYRVLGTTMDFDEYPGQVFTASRAWAAANKATLLSFIQGHLDTLDWVLDPANKDEAAEILARNMPNMKPQAIGPAIGKLMDPRTGLIPGCKMDYPGLKMVLELRSQYAPQGTQLSDPDKYIDLSYYEEAVAGR
ncbi:MAG: ABC transporter substrate-binding protein [Rhodospirillaceae bacterium]|jgi:ABC-type nitrate/sulfonate/bicarbonate transport system substrate-binding protein|nr:ABC transporter substrate-binding protein [Rhodospirillaceae bacterium]MBT5455499.1 ABC transporter substrate-binding protein [Rhodospirillaceae bacterium]